MGVLEAAAGQGHWESLQGGSEALVTKAEQETREAKADTGTWAAMADQELRVTMVVLFFGKV